MLFKDVVHKVLFGGALVLGAMGLQANAQTGVESDAQATEVNYQGRWVLGGYLEHITIDGEAALKQGIGENATGIGFNGEYFTTNLISVNLGMSLVQFDDNDHFQQQVESVGLFDRGDISTESSEVTGLQVFADLGPRYYFGEQQMSYFTARAGFSHFVNVDRGISNCSNCYEEDVDINGGGYASFGIGHDMGSYSIGLQYAHYLSGDQTSSLRLTLTSSLK